MELPAGRGGIEARRVDLDDAETDGLDAIQPAFAGIDRVFLVSGYDIWMLVQCKAAIDAARVAGVSHVAHLGASAAENTTISHLSWHLLVEAYLERSGLGYTHVRPIYACAADPVHAEPAAQRGGARRSDLLHRRRAGELGGRHRDRRLAR
ncbi:MAG: NAD(P)H-binding protein [Streptosporangiaceae bacterium]|nr:NAD(P)H-binding protein [Streptosporangiaceae bacterium]